jgi:hypothetical protein
MFKLFSNNSPSKLISIIGECQKQDKNEMNRYLWLKHLKKEMKELDISLKHDWREGAVF